MHLDQNVDHVTILIHGAPEIMLFAVDSNEDLIQVPVVAQSSLASLQFPSIVRTEFLTPLSDRLIRHNDSALGHKIFDISEAQAEAMVSQDRITDDLGRKSIAGVTRRMALHATSFSGFVLELTMPGTVVLPRNPDLSGGRTAGECGLSVWTDDVPATVLLPREGVPRRFSRSSIRLSI